MTSVSLEHAENWASPIIVAASAFDLRPECVDASTGLYNFGLGRLQSVFFCLSTESSSSLVRGAVTFSDAARQDASSEVHPAATLAMLRSAFEAALRRSGDTESCIMHVDLTLHAATEPGEVYAVEVKVDSLTARGAHHETILSAYCGLMGTQDLKVDQKSLVAYAKAVCVVRGCASPFEVAQNRTPLAGEIYSDRDALEEFLDDDLVVGFKYAPALRPLSAPHSLAEHFVGVDDVELVRYGLAAGCASCSLLQGKALAVMYIDPAKLGEAPETERTVGAVAFSCGSEGQRPGVADDCAAAAVLLDACLPLAPPILMLVSVTVTSLRPVPVESVLVVMALYDGDRIASADQRTIRAQLLDSNRSAAYVELTAEYGLMQG